MVVVFCKTLCLLFIFMFHRAKGLGDASGEDEVREELRRLDDKINEGGLENFKTCYESLSLLAEKVR